MKVDRPGGPVIIDIGVHVKAAVEEHAEGRKSGAVERQTLFSEKGVMDQPVQVYRPDRHAAHVGVPKHIIEIVGGVDSPQERLKKRQPGGEILFILLIIFFNQKGDLLRHQFFSGAKRTGRASPDLFNHRPEFVSDNSLANILMGQMKFFKKIMIKEMAERPMA